MCLKNDAIVKFVGSSFYRNGGRSSLWTFNAFNYSGKASWKIQHCAIWQPRLSWIINRGSVVVKPPQKLPLNRTTSALKHPVVGAKAPKQPRNNPNLNFLTDKSRQHEKKIRGKRKCQATSRHRIQKMATFPFEFIRQIRIKKQKRYNRNKKNCKAFIYINHVFILHYSNYGVISLTVFYLI